MPGVSARTAVEDGREELQRLVTGDEPDRARPVDGLDEGRVRPRDLHVAAQRREAVAEPPVDRALRCPQDGERLAPFADGVELGAHEVPQDAAAPVRRQDADDGDAGGPNRPARHGQFEWQGGRATDDRVAVLRDVHASLGDGDPGDEILFRARRQPEVVSDRRKGVGQLVAAGRAHLDAQRIFSSGA